MAPIYAPDYAVIAVRWQCPAALLIDCTHCMPCWLAFPCIAGEKAYDAKLVIFNNWFVATSRCSWPLHWRGHWLMLETEVRLRRLVQESEPMESSEKREVDLAANKAADDLAMLPTS